jgi:hypothetical protein
MKLMLCMGLFWQYPLIANLTSCHSLVSSKAAGAREQRVFLGVRYDVDEVKKHGNHEPCPDCLWAQEGRSCAWGQCCEVREEACHQTPEK